MSFRTTYILFAILVALLGVFGVALWLAPSRKIDSKFLFPSAQDEKTKVESGDIVKVEIRRDDLDHDLVFERAEREDAAEGAGGGEFTLTSPAGYRINTNLVYSVVGDVLQAKAVEGDLSGALKKWGLDEPKGRVVLTTRSDRELVLNIGDSSGDRIYVTTSDAPKEARVVLRNSISAVFHSLHDFRSRDLVTSRIAEITGFRAERPGKDVVGVEAEGAKWTFTAPPDLAGVVAEYDASGDATTEKGPTGLSEILLAVTGLQAKGKPLETSKPDGEKKDKKEKEKQPSPEELKKSNGFWSEDVADLKPFGLDSEVDASLVLTINAFMNAKEKDKDGNERTVKKTLDPVKILIGKEVAKSDFYYARLLPEKHVLTVAKKDLEKINDLIGNPQSLRDRDLLRYTEEQKPNVLRIRYDAKTQVDFYREGDKWTMYRGVDKQGLETDSVAIDQLLATLKTKRLVKEFIAKSDDTAHGLKDPNNLVVSIWLDGIQPPEKKEEKPEVKKDDKKPEEKKDEAKKDDTKKDDARKDDKKPDDKKPDDKKPDDKKPDPTKEPERPKLKSETPTFELTFGKVADKLVAVRKREGKELRDEVLVKVPDSLNSELSTNPLKYVKKSLPSVLPITEGNRAVTHVSLEIDGVETVLERKKPDDANSEWIVKKPTDREGRKADQGAIQSLITQLNSPSVIEWKDLNPSDLSKFGFDKPTMKIALTIKLPSASKDVTLIAGALTEDKNSYFARRSDNPGVFLVQKEVIEGARKQNLLDMQILSLGRGNVIGAKLTGWAQNEKPSVLEMTSKGMSLEGKFMLGGKDPEPFALDLVKVEELLETVANLRATEYLQYKDAEKDPRFSLKEPKLLRIEITVKKRGGKEGETESHLLTIGPALEKGYLATSSTQPGASFLIPKQAIKERDLIAKVKDSVDSLKLGGK